MKKPILFLILIGVLLLFCSCSNGPQNTDLSSISKILTDSNGKDATKSSLGSSTAQLDSNQIKPETAVQTQFIAQNQAFLLKDFTYQIKNISISKKLTGFQKKDIGYFNETADESGKLTSAHSYIFIDFSAKNTLSEEAAIYLSNFQIVSISASNVVNIKLGSDLRTFDKSQHESSVHDYYKYKFQPNEEVAFRLVYIVPDAGLKTTLCLSINPTGTVGSEKTKNPDNKKFVKLETA